MSERNPVALVVGAGDYIGAAISRRFAKGGYSVCMGRRNGDKLKPLADEITAAGGTAHGFTLDAREEEQVVYSKGPDRKASTEDDIGFYLCCHHPYPGKAQSESDATRFPSRQASARPR